MRKLTTILALGAVLACPVQLAAQVAPPTLSKPRVAPAPKSLLPAMTDAAVCVPFQTPNGLIFRCKTRGAIQSDVGRMISRDWAGRFEKDYQSIAGSLGIDPTSGSFAVCPQGGAFTRVDLSTALTANGATRSDVRPVAGRPSTFDITGAAARSIDAGCGSAGGGIGNNGEYSGDKSRGGQVSFGGFMQAGGRLNESQWDTLTGNTKSLFGGMSCRAGSGGGLVSADGGGSPSLLDQIRNAVKEFLGADTQGDRADSSATAGATSDSQIVPEQTEPDGAKVTRTLQPDGTYTETRKRVHWSGGHTEETLEVNTKDGTSRRTKAVFWAEDFNKPWPEPGYQPTAKVMQTIDYDKEGRVTSIYDTFFDDDGVPVQSVHTVFDANGRPSPGSRVGPMPAPFVPDPDRDRSCAGQQAWLNNFVAMCEAVNWQSADCFQAVLVANQCTDPRETTPTPEGPEMICRNAGKGPAFSSREQSCRQRSLIALAYPDAGGGRDCGASPASGLRPIGGPKPGLVNPVRDGINDRPVKGAPLPTCDPRDPGCSPKPQG